MALDKLSDKLDQVSGSELDFNFDETAVWTRLEAKLDKDKRSIFPWLVAAACITLFVFFPVTLLKKDISNQIVDIDTSVEVPPKLHRNEKLDLVEKRETIEVSPLHEVSKRPVELSLAGMTIPHKLNPIEIQEEKPKLQFAAKDISTIRASLEKPQVENGRAITIRAQWQKSPDELNVNYQALKIKLYEKDKNQ